MIYGTGIDIVSVSRFERALTRWGERFSRRLFTEAEVEYCNSRKRPAEHLAARFAAKEALFKALGGAVPYTSVEVVRTSGSPEIRVSGIGKGLSFFLSLSHEREFAVAHVIVERPSNETR